MREVNFKQDWIALICNEVTGQNEGKSANLDLIQSYLEAADEEIPEDLEGAISNLSGDILFEMDDDIFVQCSGETYQLT